MPKNNVTDLITDQEMAFVRNLLSGTMTDRVAAGAAGLNPDTAAYTKAKPRVRAYMLEHRAVTEQQRLQQESDLSHLPRPAVGGAVEEQRRKEERREQLRERVLDRLWEIAAMPPETTRGSITGQVKALQMIVAIEGLIPDRRAAASEKKSAPPLPPADIYRAAWMDEQQQKAIDPQPDPAPAQEEEDPRPAEPEPAPVAAAEVPPTPAMPIGPAYDRSQSVFADLFHPSETTSWAPPTPAIAPVRDTRIPFWMQNIPLARRRR